MPRYPKRLFCPFYNKILGFQLLLSFIKSSFEVPIKTIYDKSNQKVHQIVNNKIHEKIHKKKLVCFLIIIFI